jgi:hypothetical protein
MTNYLDNDKTLVGNNTYLKKVHSYSCHRYRYVLDGSENYRYRGYLADKFDTQFNRLLTQAKQKVKEKQLAISLMLTFKYTLFNPTVSSVKINY